ncbi:homocysteine S-methyltransferase [Butyrivibrio fibrisolvens]|uniref:homocysteine S-methyltransferase n=1 Tax=Butyrivibrio fibrisolvens TaxID=831 RepID=UPI000409D490|nr:homocysteine S-methyltransferase [Butyrivibrio fibrisolvens]
MNKSLNNILSNKNIMIVDGSMSTVLENLGADLNNELWTAKVLAEQPELVKKVHVNYFKAGADCGITCSYQASIPGLIKNGYSQAEAEELIERSVKIFLEARDEWWEEEGKSLGRSYPICLASVGPYGAYLADGSEYTGNYDINDEGLYDFHRRRMEILYKAGADILMIETQPSLSEALIEADIAEELGADYAISFSCADGRHTSKGELISECARVLSKDHQHLCMLGVNCTKPEYVTSLIAELKKGTDLPIVVYPNSGDVYDPTTKTWSASKDEKDFGTYAYEYMKAGASAVGGCCTTVQSHIEKVVKARDKFIDNGMPVAMHN